MQLEWVPDVLSCGLLAVCLARKRQGFRESVRNKSMISALANRGTFGGICVT
jgi:hypothetical protein